MPIAVNDVMTELAGAIATNPKLQGIHDRDNTGFLNDWLQVQLLLGNGPAKVDWHLIELNAAMEILVPQGPATPIDDRVARAKEYAASWKGRQDGTSAKNNAYSHLLARVLTEAEKRNGFSLQGPGWFEKARGVKTPDVPYMVSVVSAQVFDTQLLNAQHWKDVGVSSRHGEFTHRIQWYVICRAGIVAAAKLMQKLADFGPKQDLLASAAWDALVDRAKSDEKQSALFKAVDTNDFRCPEYFNDYLTSPNNRHKFPLLHAFLKARKEKRDTSFYLPDYIAKKVYGKNFATLTAAQQADVANRADPTKELGLIQQKHL